MGTGSKTTSKAAAQAGAIQPAIPAAPAAGAHPPAAGPAGQGSQAGPGTAGPPSSSLPAAQPGATPAAAPPAGPGTEITPVPEIVPTGRPAGVPVLIGGDNLAGSAATLVAYDGPGGPREILFATVAESSEPVLMESLVVSPTVLVPVQVQEDIHGRLPLDTEQKLHELVANAARSVNHKLKTGQAIPDQTKAYFEKACDGVSALAAQPLSVDEQTMAIHYSAQLEAIAERLDAAYSVPYAAGGRIPDLTPYEHHGTAMVTRHVLQPATPGDLQPGQHVAMLRDAGRLQSSIDPVTGQISWDGAARRAAPGKEYAVDLGGGWSAVYRPYALSDPASHEYSLRGQLEVHAPPGAGHGRELVDRLSELNLSARPMTQADAEWAYLRANVDAQGLGARKGVTDALAAAAAIHDMELHDLFHARQTSLAGLSGQALDAVARQIDLDAADRARPRQLGLLRDAVAHAAGLADGAALAASPGYSPRPERSGGWLTWGRFDVATPEGAAKLAHAWHGKKLTHRVGGSSLTEILATGVLASTERRAMMGVKPGVGMSEESDKKSGGANSVFLRVAASVAGGGRSLVWDDPSVLLGRADYYGYNGDHFGALNPKSGHSTSGRTTDPFKIAGFSAGNNEVMIANGIDLLGREAPSRIICQDSGERAAVLSLLSARGVTHLGGRPVADVVIT